MRFLGLVQTSRQGYCLSSFEKSYAAWPFFSKLPRLVLSRGDSIPTLIEIVSFMNWDLVGIWAQIISESPGTSRLYAHVDDGSPFVWVSAGVDELPGLSDDEISTGSIEDKDPISLYIPQDASVTNRPPIGFSPPPLCARAPGQYGPCENCEPAEKPKRIRYRATVLRSDPAPKPKRAKKDPWVRPQSSCTHEAVANGQCLLCDKMLRS